MPRDKWKDYHSAETLHDAIVCELGELAEARIQAEVTKKFSVVVIQAFTDVIEVYKSFIESLNAEGVTGK